MIIDNDVIKYLPKETTIQNIIDYAENRTDKQVHKISLICNGWHSMFGKFILVHAGNINVFATKSEGIMPYNAFVKERIY